MTYYRYKCACGQDPMHGHVKSTEAKEKAVLAILDGAWSAQHSKPGCTPASEARTTSGTRIKREKVKAAQGKVK